MAGARFEKWLKKKWVLHGSRIIFAVLITLLLSPFQLNLFKYTSYDLRAKMSPEPRGSGDIVLMPIEFDTLKKLKHEPQALDWALVLQKLGQAKPAAIVSFINPTQIQGSFDDLHFLAGVAEKLPFQYGDDDLPKTGLTKLDPLAPPFEKIQVGAAPKTADRTVLAKDGITRRLILTYQGHFTMHPQLAEMFNGIKDPSQYKGVFSFLDSRQMLIHYRKKGAYPTLKFIDALEKPINPALVKGKIVLIGRDTLESTKDYVTTPLSSKFLALSNLEMHANILNTLILNEAPRFSPGWVTLLVTFLISLLTIYIVLSVRPGRGLLMLAGSVGAFLLLSVAAFAAFGWITPVAHPLVAVFICYYFVIPYRLIVENRRSWEYYQKNKLLTQVEELKSNFMRMMSHDLKTPLARIQGMTDVIRKAGGSLDTTQAKALDTISESSEELTEFIGSILSLSRIESKEMKLQLKSRDINEILTDAIRKCAFIAKKKHIEVVTELEPLFSVRVDEDLIKTVFVNLVENAVKYSDENSRVLITSEEINNELVIQVADQGRGIPEEEVPRVFDRFFRARNSRTSTPGNGLGLYLARYFVELHNGQIEVESELQRGSTFTVRLPMDLNLEIEQSEQGGLHA